MQREEPLQLVSVKPGVTSKRTLPLTNGLRMFVSRRSECFYCPLEAQMRHGGFGMRQKGIWGDLELDLGDLVGDAARGDCAPTPWRSDRPRRLPSVPGTFANWLVPQRG